MPFWSTLGVWRARKALLKSQNMQKIVNFFLSAKLEALKINWPTREQVTRYTMIVLAVSAFVAMLLGSLDYIFSLIFRKLILGD